jgi:hypothetical protein
MHINPHCALLADVERLALEGFAPAAIARSLNVPIRPVQTRFRWLRELERLPRDWRPTRE